MGYPYGLKTKKNSPSAHHLFHLSVFGSPLLTFGHMLIRTVPLRNEPFSLNSSIYQRLTHASSSKKAEETITLVVLIVTMTRSTRCTQAGKVRSVSRKSNIGSDWVNPSIIANDISTSSSNADVAAGTEAGPAWTATGPSSASNCAAPGPCPGPLQEVV